MNTEKNPECIEDADAIYPTTAQDELGKWHDMAAHVRAVTVKYELSASGQRECGSGSAIQTLEVSSEVPSYSDLFEFTTLNPKHEFELYLCDDAENDARWNELTRKYSAIKYRKYDCPPTIEQIISDADARRTALKKFSAEQGEAIAAVESELFRPLDGFPSREYYAPPPCGECPHDRSDWDCEWDCECEETNGEHDCDETDVEHGWNNLEDHQLERITAIQAALPHATVTAYLFNCACHQCDCCHEYFFASVKIRWGLLTLEREYDLGFDQEEMTILS